MSDDGWLLEVDITNYILIELGQPLHAFDLDLLKDKKIIVRRAAQKEKIKTLDGVERELTDETLVIADAQRAVAVGRLCLRPPRRKSTLIPGELHRHTPIIILAPRPAVSKLSQEAREMPRKGGWRRLKKILEGTGSTFWRPKSMGI